MNEFSKISLPGVRGSKLLNDHVRTHGTAFTVEERRQNGLEGLLPPAVETMQRQSERVGQQLDTKLTDLDRYIYLIELADRNETLFYHVVMPASSRYPTIRPSQRPA
jgi:malate dehydrogenase (oxaloacetate-decarboxylating)(NADP+)